MARSYVGCQQNASLIGHPLHAEYVAWRNMRFRCSAKPGTKWHADYVIRGITVCARWLGRNGFAAFVEDMGKRPSAAHSLDRKNNAKGYSPSNCRWVLLPTQARNSRRNRQLTYGRRTMSIVEWAEEVGVHQNLIAKRLSRGWSTRDAIFGRT